VNSEISTSSDKDFVAIRLSTLSTNTTYMIKKNKLGNQFFFKNMISWIRKEKAILIKKK